MNGGKIESIDTAGAEFPGFFVQELELHHQSVIRLIAGARPARSRLGIDGSHVNNPKLPIAMIAGVYQFTSSVPIARAATPLRQIMVRQQAEMQRPDGEMHPFPPYVPV